jgi:predicted nucleic acid-binding protein
MINLVLDTNILIYALDKDSIFHEKSKEIMESSAFNQFITTKSISEYFAVCSKLDIEHEKMIAFYDEIEKNITFLFPTDKSLSLFTELIGKYKPRGNRIFDIEIVSVMLANDVKNLATFNIADFKNITEINLLPLG